MKIAKEFSNSQPVNDLGNRKLYSLLDVPQEQREDFMLEAAIVKYLDNNRRGRVHVQNLVPYKEYKIE